MSVMQGNRGSFNVTNLTGYTPEITEHGVFNLRIMVADGAGVSEFLVHSAPIEFATEDREALEGHARECFFYILKNAVAEINLFFFVHQLQDIANKLSASDLPELEREILSLPEGSTVYVHKNRGSHPYELFFTRANAYKYWGEAKDDRSLLTVEIVSIGPDGKKKVHAQVYREENRRKNYGYYEDETYYYD